MEQVDASIARCLGMLDTAYRQEDRVAELRVARLSERLEALRRQLRQLQVMEQAVADTPDHQVSLTDPDARATASNGKGTGMVGYHVQTGCRCQTPSDHRASGHKRRPRQTPTGQHGTAGEGR